MATPQQRAYMYRQVNQFRQTKPIFVLDFWNDGDHSGGCTGAGGISTLMPPGMWNPVPLSTMRRTTSKTKASGKLWPPPLAAYRKRIPFNENHLRPVPHRQSPDDPEMVAEAGARSTQEQSHYTPEELARSLEVCRGLGQGCRQVKERQIS